MNNENNVEGNEAGVVDVEEFAKTGKPVPRGKKYRIRIDKERFTVDSSTIKGSELLHLVGKAPDKYNLYQHIRGERPKLIAADHKVDLTGPGVERFSTMKIENTEGKERAARRSFKLPPEDEGFLNHSFEFWESITEANSQWVIIEKFPLPEGFDVPEAAVALRIAPTYPDDQIDMAYFYPSIFRADGKAVRGLSPLNLDGKVWQQWSRHRVGNDAWRPDIDGIETHLLYVTAFLDGELKK
ncbi:MAG TPA: multiubiquitin domain-containing protein [Pyrinomonadaceae bacterium]|nr:multiubiquitin domain-containing protein [Pyrinomonadaceae bacterium]